MTKKKGLMAAALCALLVYVPMQAAGYYQTKKVGYLSPVFYYNGSQKVLSAQPVIIDNTAYLPVRAVGEATGLGVNWTGSSLSITSSNSSSDYSMQAQLQAKDLEIASLKKELQDLRNAQGIVTATSSSSSSGSSSYTQTSGTDILGTELTDTENRLENLYEDYFDDIDFDFDVSLSSSRINVTITYDTSSENRAFNKLSDREIKNFLEDVCETVRDRHDDIVITGRIRYDSSTKYSFTYSRGDSFSASSGSSSYDSYSGYNDISRSRVIKIVEDEDEIDIDDYSKSLSIRDADADVDDYREEVTFTVYIDLEDNEDAVEAWNDNTGTDNNSSLKASMKRIAQEIADETDYDIYGVIRDENSEIGRYDYEDNELRTYTVD